MDGMGGVWTSAQILRSFAFFPVFALQKGEGLQNILISSILYPQRKVGNICSQHILNRQINATTKVRGIMGGISH